MIQFYWNATKNLWLKETRGIFFEDILKDLENGGLLDIVDHPNPSKYPGQKIFIVNHDGYCVLIPFIPKDDGYYLKTLFQSRKATQKYLRGQ